jgi:nitroreductase
MLRRFRIEPREVNTEFPQDGTTREKMMYLLRLAVLAPSIHNTQPWKFSVDRNRIGIFADRARWLSAADPDQRDLRMSLGCVLENLLVAARYYGYEPDVTYSPRAGSPDFVAIVDLSRRATGRGTRRDATLQALKRRRTQYGASEARSVPPTLIAQLEKACEEAGAVLYVTSDPAVRTGAAALFREANARQLADPRYQAETVAWLAKGEYGLPRVARALGRAGLPQLEKVLEKEANQIAAAPYFGVILAPTDDALAQLRAGQAFERVWIGAAAARVGLRPASAITEVAATRARLAKLVDAGALKAMQPFRLGYGEPRGRRAPRRPVGEAIIAVPLH